jgi:hypothetical protein
MADLIHWIEQAHASNAGVLTLHLEDTKWGEDVSVYIVLDDDIRKQFNEVTSSIDYSESNPGAITRASITYERQDDDSLKVADAKVEQK